MIPDSQELLGSQKWSCLGIILLRVSHYNVCFIWTSCVSKGCTLKNQNSFIRLGCLNTFVHSVETSQIRNKKDTKNIH